MSSEHVNLRDITRQIEGVEEQVADVAAAVQDVRKEQGAMSTRIAHIEQTSKDEGEIVELIDNRLEHFAHTVMPSVVRLAVRDELAGPLVLVGQSIAGHKANQKAIDALQQSMEVLTKQTEPLIEIHEGMVFVRHAILAVGGVVLMVAGIIAATHGWF